MNFRQRLSKSNGHPTQIEGASMIVSSSTHVIAYLIALADASLRQRGKHFDAGSMDCLPVSHASIPTEEPVK